MVFFTNSCKKDQTTNDLQRSDQIISIAEAKNYFQQNFSEAKSAEILKNNPNPTPFQKIKKTVLWDEAKECEISIGKAVKVPILFDNDFFTKLGEKETQLSLYELSYLLIYKDKSNKIHTEWIITIPDNESLNNKKSESTGFYGLVYILDWFGTFNEAYQAKRNGDIYSTKDFSISYEQTPSIKVNGYYLECETVAWYSCVTALQSKSGPYIIKTLTTCHYDYSVTSCHWGFASTGYVTRTSGDGSRPEGGGGSGAAGSAGSGESGRNEIVDDNKLTEIMSPNSKLNDTQKSLLNNVLEVLLTDCANNSIFNTLTQHQKITINVDPNSKYPALYNVKNNSITFKSNNNINFDNVQEELFHAYQNYQYPGGTLQYAGASGSANIEFEAKLFKDINCLIRTGLCQQAFTNNIYTDWLYHITDYNSKYPRSISDTDFQIFIGQWLIGNPGYANTIINTTLSPTAINNLLKQIPCK